MDKWEKLKNLLRARVAWPVHYSHSREYEQGEIGWVMREMEGLEKEEENEKITSGNTWLFTDIPTFDQKAFERIIEEKGLQGLS